MAEEVVAEKKGGKGFLLIIIIVILVLLLVVGGLIAFLALGDDEAPAAADTAVATTQVATQASPASKAANKRSSDYLNMGPIYPLDAFTVNLLSENGSRFLKTKIDLEQPNEKAAETLTPELDKKKSAVRDIIIKTLTSKTYEEVSTAKGKDKLKDEIVKSINEILSDGYIKNLYFTDFVIQ